MPELVDLEESFGVAPYLEPMDTIVLTFGEASQQECSRVKPFTCGRQEGEELRGQELTILVKGTLPVTRAALSRLLIVSVASQQQQPGSAGFQPSVCEALARTIGTKK